MLRESPGLSEVQREHLQTIQSSGEDLLGLINNILDVSRLENSSVTLERTPFAVRDVVEAALDTLASSAQTKNLEVCLISSFKSDPPGVFGDSFRIKQVRETFRQVCSYIAKQSLISPAGLVEPFVECGQIHVKGQSDGPLGARNKAKQYGSNFAHRGGYCTSVLFNYSADVD